MQYESAALERLREDVYPHLSHVVTEPEWRLYAPLIHEIRELKRRRNAVVLAHNYQPVEIFHGIADVTGDSLALARAATEVDADVIVMCGVEFMAETAALLNPARTVLIPSRDAGCTLADSITAKDVERLRDRYPGVPIVTYVNTSAAVKAVSDVCCTSSNAVDVVESVAAESESDRVILLPDRYLAVWVAEKTDVQIIDWQGTCVVHEKFTTQDIDALRAQYDDIVVVVHPECSPAVQDAADFLGSTSQIIDYVETNRPPKVAMITECTMGDNIAERCDGVDFIQPCSLCPYMKRITLENVRDALDFLRYPVAISEDVARPARRSVERMLELSARRDAEVGDGATS